MTLGGSLLGGGVAPRSLHGQDRADQLARRL